MAFIPSLSLSVHRPQAPRTTRRPLTTPSACAAPAQNLEAAWAPFSASMAASDSSPPTSDWNALFAIARDARDDPAAAIWALERMQASGRTATAATYEILLEVCLQRGDEAAAFLLIEKMWKDKVLLGDVSLPEGMEKTLRSILPPEAFD